MGRRSQSGGVRPKGDRIEFDLLVDGKRRKPTIDMAPTQTNLKYARKRHEEIKRKIRNGTFVFSEEFPDYKLLHEVENDVKRPTFAEVADLYMRVIGSDIQYSTRDTYRVVLDNFWKPRIGFEKMIDIQYSTLKEALSSHEVTPKSRNNLMYIARRIFNFAMDDGIIKENVAERLKPAKVQKKGPDPYTVAEAETLIETLRAHYGNSDANYFEFSFFTGVRPSEAISILWTDIDFNEGIVRIDKARVKGRDKNQTKTARYRDVELCPRAIDTLKRQKENTGLGDRVFPYHDTQVQWKRWAWVHKKTGIRYREPYQTRHSHITWELMYRPLKFMWIAQQHGHSSDVMFAHYGKWLKEQKDTDQIKRAMGFVTDLLLDGSSHR